MGELKEKLEAEISGASFTFFEIQGFRVKPSLALLAGALIGYQYALKEIAKKEFKPWNK